MADLPAHLLRLVARCFYPTDHILVIETLLVHSTLSDQDLAHVLGYSANTKSLRRLCGRLKEDGLLSIQQRTERRTDGSGGAFYDAKAGADGKGGMKERVSHRDWYYLNFHHAIDSIKFRMHKANKTVDAMGAPATEKMDYHCTRCKSSFTEMDALEGFDYTHGGFSCKKCHNILEPIDHEERASENETQKRFNLQMEPIQKLLIQIDATTVPENNFEEALAKQKPIFRTNVNPASRTEIIDNPNRNLASSKGLALKPEKIAVQVQDDETVKREELAAEQQARREKEARQNALPEWISKSTISGDVTAVGAKEARERAAREAHTGASSGSHPQDVEEDKKPDKGDEDVMNAYWAELAQQREREAVAQAEDDDEGDEDDDEFEDVDVSAAAVSAPAQVNGAKRAIDEAGGNSGVASSSATDDERDVKRAKTKNGLVVNGASTNGDATPVGVIEGTPAASDEDDDELEFQDV
jgi:transcription initiation factor TFIIE subunit alpha